MVEGQLRFSVFADRISLWINRRLWAAFKLPELPGDTFRIAGTHTGSVSVFIPRRISASITSGLTWPARACSFSPSWSGRSGSSSRMTGAGRLRVFIQRPVVNTEAAPERRVIEAVLTDTTAGRLPA